MTGSLDTSMRDAAFDICKDVGRLYDVVNQTSETYDPTTGLAGGISSSTMEILGSPPLGYDDRLIDNNMIHQGDVSITVPFKQTALLDLDSLVYAGLKRSSPGQRWAFDGDDWTTVAIKPVYSGETIAAYEFQLRK
jgi:hypothetical protein